MLSLGAIATSNAALTQWQTEVGNGTSAAATLFTTVSAPQQFDIGTLTGARTYEFIVNASTAGVSGALIGDARTGSGRQGMKFDQANQYGITDYGVIDRTSGVTPIVNTNIHLAFVFDGTDTTIYENGSLVATMAGVSLRLTGDTTLAGAINDDTTNSDPLNGDILGFASYDSALTSTEITTHSNAFTTVPEPSSAALLSLAGLTLILRRRK